MSSITRQFQTYYGIHLDHWSETWGGVTYHKMLAKSYPTINLVSTTTTTSAATFLYPTIYKDKYYLDGTADGWITLYNQSSVATVTAYTVELRKTDDVPNNETVLGTYTGTLTADNTIAASAELVLPVYMSISKQVINANEKLILNISITSTGGDPSISHANSSTSEQLKIRLPYVPQG